MTRRTGTSYNMLRCCNSAPNTDAGAHTDVDIDRSTDANTSTPLSNRPNYRKLRTDVTLRRRLGAPRWRHPCPCRRRRYSRPAGSPPLCGCPGGEGRRPRRHEGGRPRAKAPRGVTIVESFENIFLQHGHTTSAAATARTDAVKSISLLTICPHPPPEERPQRIPGTEHLGTRAGGGRKQDGGGRWEEAGWGGRGGRALAHSLGEPALAPCRSLSPGRG